LYRVERVIKVNSPTPGIKTPKQPDALDEPVARHLPPPLHHITIVEYVRFVGCKWSFYRGMAPFGHWI
jgi:hypothetical protein